MWHPRCLFRHTFTVALGAALALAVLGCQTVAETVYKGRPPSPPPEYLSGDKVVAVRISEWLHPHVFVGEFELDGKTLTDTFIEVEELSGFSITAEGVARLPMWLGSNEVPPSTSEERAASAEQYPVGSTVVVCFPLRGKEIRDADPTYGDTRSYSGYLIRIEQR